MPARFALAALLGIASPCLGQGYTPTIEDLGRASAQVAAWVETGRVPGAVVSVHQHGRRVFEASYGAAQTHRYGRGQYTPGRSRLVALDRPVPMSVETVFDLASVTKVMATTTAVALLVDQGRLDLRAPVSRYLTDFVGDGKGSITVEHLLTHRSGLSQWQPVYYDAANADAAYAFIRDTPLEWPVGRERRYSDLGFMLLGRLVEEVTGQGLPDFLTTALYEPMGLVRTGFRPASAREVDPVDAGDFAATSHGNPFERRMVHDAGFGYRIDTDPNRWDGWRERTLVGEVNDGNAFHAFGGEAGHAGLFSNAPELQRLLRLWTSGGRVEGRRYVSEEVVSTFLDDTGDGQALGWQRPDYAPDGAFAHTGFTGTFVFGDPTSGITIVLLTNRQNGGVDAATTYPDIGELQRGVVRSLTGVRRP